MTDENSTSAASAASSSTHSDPDDARAARNAQRVMSVTGYMMLLVATVGLGFIGYRLIESKHDYVADRDADLTDWVVRNYMDEMFLLIGAGLIIFVGWSLLRIAGKDVQTTILADDRDLLEPLIRAADKEAIKQYVVISSLTGFTGTFQKIGFTGLPLATVFLTIIFSALSFLEPEFLELAKLTLGAFIGSFVQKGVDEARLSSMRD